MNDRGIQMLMGALDTSVYQVVLCIRVDDRSWASATVVQLHGKEYVVTADHVYPDTNEPVLVRHDNQWKRIPDARVIYRCLDLDFVVIATDMQLIGGNRPYAEGQNLYGALGRILGFPQTVDSDLDSFALHSDTKYPIPIAVPACCNMGADERVGWIGGFSSHGFSGGAVIDLSPGLESHRIWSVSGIVVARGQILNETKGRFVYPHGKGDEVVEITEPAGLTKYVRMRHVLEMIEKHGEG